MGFTATAGSVVIAGIPSLLARNWSSLAPDFIQGEDEIYLGIDEHSFRHQGLVHTVTEVKKRRVLGILRDDRIATLKEFLSKIPEDKTKEVCIDMTEKILLIGR